MGNNYNVEITSNKIHIIYDGELFNVFNLLSHSKADGGADTLQEIIKSHSDSFVINYSYDTVNHVIIHLVKDFDKLLDVLPCIITIDEFDTSDVVDNINIHENCGALFVVLPMHFCRSDVRELESSLSAFEPTGKPVFIVGSDVSENTKKAIINKFPNFSFVHKIA